MIVDPRMVFARVVRVRGGYMNRWWIRSIVLVPTWRMIAGRIYVHPEVLEKLSARYPMEECS